nr:unnamed protein product [Digitaria exilis]
MHESPPALYARTDRAKSRTEGKRTSKILHPTVPNPCGHQPNPPCTHARTASPRAHEQIAQQPSHRACGALRERVYVFVLRSETPKQARTNRLPSMCRDAADCIYNVDHGNIALFTGSGSGLTCTSGSTYLDDTHALDKDARPSARKASDGWMAGRRGVMRVAGDRNAPRGSFFLFPHGHHAAPLFDWQLQRRAAPLSPASSQRVTAPRARVRRAASLVYSLQGVREILTKEAPILSVVPVSPTHAYASVSDALYRLPLHGTRDDIGDLNKVSLSPAGFIVDAIIAPGGRTRTHFPLFRWLIKGNLPAPTASASCSLLVLGHCSRFNRAQVTRPPVHFSRSLCPCPWPLNRCTLEAVLPPPLQLQETPPSGSFPLFACNGGVLRWEDSDQRR